MAEKTKEKKLKTFTVRVVLAQPIASGLPDTVETWTIQGHSLKDAKKRAGIS